MMKMVVAVKKNLNLILFVLMMILLIVLAYWISERVISHLDQQVPGIGMTNTKVSSEWSVVSKNPYIVNSLPIDHSPLPIGIE